jgi:hypothetical protein
MRPGAVLVEPDDLPDVVDAPRAGHERAGTSRDVKVPPAYR